MLKENLEAVEERIRAACTRAGRNRDEVTLIAVSKTKPVEMLQGSLWPGRTCFRREQGAGNPGQVSADAGGYAVAYDRTSADE